MKPLVSILMMIGSAVGATTLMVLQNGWLHTLLIWAVLIGVGVYTALMVWLVS